MISVPEAWQSPRMPGRSQRATSAAISVGREARPRAREIGPTRTAPAARRSPNGRSACPCRRCSPRRCHRRLRSAERLQPGERAGRCRARQARAARGSAAAAARRAGRRGRRGPRAGLPRYGRACRRRHRRSGRRPAPTPMPTESSTRMKARRHATVSHVRAPMRARTTGRTAGGRIRDADHAPQRRDRGVGIRLARRMHHRERLAGARLGADRRAPR